MDLKSIEVSAAPLETYPKDNEQWVDLLYNVYTDMLSFLVTENPEAVSFSLFITKDIKNVETITGLKLKKSSKGAVVVIKNIKDDSLFYLNSLLKGDGFIKLLEPDLFSKNSHDTIAVWQRDLGLNAVKWSKDREEYTELDEKYVIHILPLSVMDDKEILRN